MKIAVAVSGGVDSSVSLHLLKQAGHDLVALFMKNWDDSDDAHCPAERDYEDALMVAAKVGVPLYAFDFSDSYWHQVFSHFLDDLRLGATPNPDILCNREIKFKVLLEKARELGADAIATGHYAQIVDGKLARGLDPSKDQSYFLYAIDRNALQQTLFPVGHLEKSEVRKIAKEQGLITHNKRDSTGICFIGKRNFSSFISEYMPKAKGVFTNLNGEILGEHDGAWFYTIGQRKGLGIGGPGDAWFVADKDIQTHEVVIVQGENHPALFSQELSANDVNWVSGAPEDDSFRCTAKIRYRTQDQACTVTKTDQGVKVVFDTPVRAATVRQAIVFYQGNICLGGGSIQEVKKSLLLSSRQKKSSSCVLI